MTNFKYFCWNSTTFLSQLNSPIIHFLLRDFLPTSVLTGEHYFNFFTSFLEYIKFLHQAEKIIEILNQLIDWIYLSNFYAKNSPMPNQSEKHNFLFLPLKDSIESGLASQNYFLLALIFQVKHFCRKNAELWPSFASTYKNLHIF